MKTNEKPRNASVVFCPNQACSARGIKGKGNIVIHEPKRGRYCCKTCGKRFTTRSGTAYEGLRRPMELIELVVALYSYGCPVQAMVFALRLDERTIRRWCVRAGNQCQMVHKAMVETGQIQGTQVQADEIWVKGWGWKAWMGLTLL